MRIKTIPGANPGACRVYKLGTEDQAVIDKEFDALHALGKMEWAPESTPYAYPVFVVWTTTHLMGKPPTRRGRVVVDIRGLNKISEHDAYPMPLQSDILSKAQGCPYISVMDCTTFFHQWRIAIPDRHKLTVVTHRGAEQWNVGVMGHRNTGAYVQREMDNILRDYPWVKAYIDDVIVFSKSLDEHLGYPSIPLLGQKVDSLGLTTAEDKLKAIAKLSFPKTLKDLEKYLGATGWLRDYVAYYAQKAEPLQERKTNLLKGGPIKGKPRKSFSLKTLIENPSSVELDAYNQLQSDFSRARWLTHYNRIRQLYADVDASKKGFGVIVYHLKEGVDGKSLKGPPSKRDIEPILFLSKTLSSAESRYWPTELEMAGLVWTVRKMAHMIKSSEHPTIIYTDHGATPAIAAATKLTTSSTDRLNMKLVRASMYLSQFRLDIRHRPGKSNVIPDALSRLPVEKDNSSHGALDLDQDRWVKTFHSGRWQWISSQRFQATWIQR
jgi:hypothetical protein